HRIGQTPAHTLRRLPAEAERCVPPRYARGRRLRRSLRALPRKGGCGRTGRLRHACGGGVGLRRRCDGNRARPRDRYRRNDPQAFATRYHSTLICAASMTLPHSRVSCAKNAVASAGEPIIGSRVSFARLSMTSGRRRLATTSPLIRLASAAGVVGGATMANQVTERKPGNPDSSSVGRSATTGERSALPTARILTLPPRYIGTEVVRVSKNMSIWPAMTSLSAGTAPRYGTCTILMSPSTSSWLAERWAVEPAPWDP